MGKPDLPPAVDPQIDKGLREHGEASTNPSGNEGNSHPPKKSRQQLDRELHRALKDSFPSSDPSSITQPTPNEPAGDPRVKP